MTVSPPTRQVLPALADPAAAALEAVTFDLYRDVHKGIRAELFALTASTGRLDVADGDAVSALVARLLRFLDLLDDHATHEEQHLGRLVAGVDDALAERVAHEHRVVEATMTDLRELGAVARAAPSEARRVAVHRLYLAAASFTSEYLAHLSTEELEVMPVVAAQTPLDELLDVSARLVGSIVPADLDDYIAIIVPAQNPADRLEMIAGMREGAPAEAFAGWLDIAAEVLSAADIARLHAELRMTP
jgi:hypothetical protein